MAEPNTAAGLPFIVTVPLPTATEAPHPVPEPTVAAGMPLIKTSDDGVIALNLKDGFHIDNQYAVKDDDNIKIIR